MPRIVASAEQVKGTRVRFACGHERVFEREQDRSAPKVGESWPCKYCTPREDKIADLLRPTRNGIPLNVWGMSYGSTTVGTNRSKGPRQ